MQTPWFARFGWLHRPVTLAGWLVTLSALAYVVQVFVAIDLRSHSVSDTLYAVYPHFGVTFLGWDWIVRRSTPTRV